MNGPPNSGQMQRLKNKLYITKKRSRPNPQSIK